MKSVFIGSVGGSSVTVLNEMISIGFPIDCVFSLDEKYSSNVSGYFPIHEIAEKNRIPYIKFRKIGDKENVEIIRKIQPDYIFVIGLSQLIPKEIIDIAKEGVVGFHPAPLPKFRGRASIVWQMLLGIKESKCSLFFIDEGIDSGPILGQEDYYIDDDDYVSDVSYKINIALRNLSKKVLIQMMNGTLKPLKQNEKDATYLLARRPEDGLIQWESSSKSIIKLVRATSHPYPGAYGLYDGSHKIVIWRAEYVENSKYIGIPGTICELSDESIVVVGKDGLIKITEWDNIDGVKLIVGHKLK